MSASILDQRKLKELEHIICEYFQYTPEELRSRYRYRDLVDARQSFFYFARKHTRASLSLIGAYLRYNHATVIHSINNIDNLIESKDKDTIQRIKELTELVQMSILTSRFSREEFINDNDFKTAIAKDNVTRIELLKDHVEADHTMQGYNKQRVLELINGVMAGNKLLISV